MHSSSDFQLLPHLALDLLVPVVAAAIRKIAYDAAKPELANEEIGTLAVGHLCAHRPIQQHTRFQVGLKQIGALTNGLRATKLGG